MQYSSDWRRPVLLAAALYNILWGGWVVLFPNHVFDLLDMVRPLYPMIWQSVGMIVGVYGIGYAIAAFDPDGHWPIVLVGFLGKVFGPIGFVYHYWLGNFPAGFWWITLFNDLIWIVPFFLILKSAYRHQLTSAVRMTCTTSAIRSRLRRPGA